MIKDANPPLKIGQILKCRDESRPRFKIVEGYPSANGMRWGVANSEKGPIRKMTLSEIYAEFIFDN